MHARVAWGSQLQFVLPLPFVLTDGFADCAEGSIEKANKLVYYA
jgi:hypothetical protein